MENDLLIYGTEYHLYRDGEYIGVGTWTDDPNIGEAFIHKMEDGSMLVFEADKWFFKA
jgi:hypothetical protein